MPEVSGATASITFATGYTSHAFRWNISYVAEELEVTEFTDTGREYIGGFKSWSGSYECWLSDTTALVAPGAAKASATFTYHTGRTLTGNIVVTSIEPSVHVDGSARSVVINFRGCGTPTPA